MKIHVYVTPGSSRVRWEAHTGLDGERIYKARLTVPPVDGKANSALIELVAEQFGVPRRRVHILRGHQSRYKQVSVEDL